MRVRRRVLTVLAGVACVLAVASPAAAWDVGSSLRANDRGCSDQVQSDNGARVVGFFSAGSGVWTVLATPAAGGPETEVYRSPAGTTPGTVRDLFLTVPAPAAGTFRYRACLTVTRPVLINGGSVTYYRLSVHSTSPTAVDDVGPETATLSPGATACGDFAWGAALPGSGPARLVGAASAPVTWSWQGFDLDYAFLGRLAAVTGATVDLAYPPGPAVSTLEACATNTSGSTATVEFELSND